MRRYIDELLTLWIGYLFIVPWLMACVFGALALVPEAPLAVQIFCAAFWASFTVFGLLVPLREL